MIIPAWKRLRHISSMHLRDRGREIAMAGHRVVEGALVWRRTDLLHRLEVHHRREVAVDGVQKAKSHLAVILALGYRATIVDAFQVATEVGDGVRSDTDIRLDARVVKLLVEHVELEVRDVPRARRVEHEVGLAPIALSLGGHHLL